MDNNMALLRLFLLLACCAGARGYRMFADRIPNGERVPHPCKTNVIWRGVGHFNAQGGGFRNPFGHDFDQAGKSWTPALCRQDSDGDGRSNGEELGDPLCVWTVGDIPQSTQGISHPGICEPVDSAGCRQRKYDWGLFHDQREWMDDACKPSEFDCPAIHGSDVRTVPVRLDPTPVPAKRTTYVCQIMDFPDVSQDFHLIAATPVLNNSNILHHMVIFGCDDSVPARSTYKCDMLPDERCKLILTAWALGLNGDCFHRNAGVKLGQNGLKKLAVQVHWNNPGLVDHYTDSSGVLLHYTPHLRPFDSSAFLLGNNNFAIPPRTPSTVVTSRCAPSCTRSKLAQTIYVTSAINHMHYLGHRMRVEQYRNGSLVKTITNDLVYDYDSPKVHFFDDPIPVEPGDELRTMCDFSSLYKTSPTVWGVSIADEMCFAFLFFYPRQSIVNNALCTTYGSISSCDPQTWKGCTLQDEHLFYGDVSQLEVFHNVTKDCRPSGPCTPQCMQTVLAARAAQPCLASGEVWDRIVDWGLRGNPAGQQLLSSLASCQAELDKLVSQVDPIATQGPISIG